jgi:hypothetical protein
MSFAPSSSNLAQATTYMTLEQPPVKIFIGEKILSVVDTEKRFGCIAKVTDVTKVVSFKP